MKHLESPNSVGLPAGEILIVRWLLLIWVNCVDEARQPVSVRLYTLSLKRRTKQEKTRLTMASLILAVTPTCTLGYIFFYP